MDDMSFIQYLIGQTGLAGIAAFALWTMKIWHDETIKRDQEHLDKEILRTKEQAEQDRQDKMIMVEALTRNTEANARLNEAIIRIDRHIMDMSKEMLKG